MSLDSSIIIILNNNSSKNITTHEPVSTAAMQSRRPTPLRPLATAKCNSIANYSYPRYDDSTSRCSAHGPWSPSCSTPLDFEVSSPPGLIDDRTDSEASGDDEHHYQAHNGEGLNTFWRAPKYQQQGKTAQDKSLLADEDISPLQKYPALIPAPKGPSKPRVCENAPQQHAQVQQAWPLCDRTAPAQAHVSKQIAADFPPRTCSRLSSQSQRPPSRPPTAATTTTATTQQQRALPLPKITTSPPLSGPLDQRKGSCSSPISVPKSPIYASSGEIHRSASHLPVSLIPQSNNPSSQTHSIRPYKSTNHLSHNTNSKKSISTTTRPSISEPEAEPHQPEQLEPRSVFEYDDDESDTTPNTGGISPTLSFFRFHKRGESRRSNANKSISHQPSTSISELEPHPHQQRRRSRPRRGSSITATDSLIAPLQGTEHLHKKRKDSIVAAVDHETELRERKQSLDMASFSFPAGVKPRQSAVLSRMLGRRRR